MDGGVPLTFDLWWLKGGRGVRSSPGLPANSSVPLGSGDPFFKQADRGGGAEAQCSVLHFEVLFCFVFLICKAFYNQFFSVHRPARF